MLKSSSYFLSALLAAVLFGSIAQAFKVPALKGPVMDEVGLLRPQIQNQLAGDLFDFKQSTGVQIQVYITSSLQEEPIESVALQIFDQWKLGSEKKDQGILFLIAPNEKRLRMEVGQGLEGSVPDVIAKRIISEVVTPSFRRGQFSEGILQGVSSLKAYILTGEEGNLAPEKPKIPASYLLIGFLAIFGVIFLISPSLAFHILLSLLSGGRGGGGSGGGSWSGGGGRSSGGGASGSW